MIGSGALTECITDRRVDQRKIVWAVLIVLARIAGAYIVTTCGDYHLDLADDLGADRAIDHRSENFPR